MHVVRAARRLAIQPRGYDGQYGSVTNRPTGTWCEWVHLARLILADEKTLAEMPDHYREYQSPGVSGGVFP
jgi:hypothetical protein